MEVESISVDGPLSMDGTKWEVIAVLKFNVYAKDSTQAILNVVKKLEEEL